jgi:RNA polymerase-binding transcription factor DksA
MLTVGGVYIIKARLFDLIWSWGAEHNERESVNVGKTSKKTSRQPHSKTGAKPGKARTAVKKKSVKRAKASTSRTVKSAARPAKKPARRAAASTRPTTPSKSTRTEAPAVSPPPQRSKGQTGLGRRDMQHYLDLLLAKRRELVGDMSSMEREALRAGGGSNLSNLPIHMADMGTDNYEQEFTLGLMEKDRQLLREINIALGKIQNGVYGICEGTGKPIGKPRLEAQPWARYSIEYARKMEKRQGL